MSAWPTPGQNSGRLSKAPPSKASRDLATINRRACCSGARRSIRSRCGKRGATTFTRSSNAVDRSGKRARWSAPTGLYTRGRPWRWSTFLSHTNFVNLDKQALGFSYYFELGAGISYEINVRPLDWFGLRFIGFEAGAILGDDVDGYAVGITFK